VLAATVPVAPTSTASAQVSDVAAQPEQRTNVWPLVAGVAVVLALAVGGLITARRRAREDP